jgi:hypothetical protein
MDAFKRSLDNYLTSNDREFGDVNPCVDGHEWGGVMVDSNGAYKLCHNCDTELNVTNCEECFQVEDMDDHNCKVKGE